MTVKELLKELINYPNDLEVFITDETIGGKINIEFVSDECDLNGDDPRDNIPYVILVTNAYQGT